LGLISESDQDITLAGDLLTIMEQNKVDFTVCFRSLSQLLKHSSDHTKSTSLAQLLNLQGDKAITAFDQWQQRWFERQANELQDLEQKIALMDSVNPIYIPRNHKVEEALLAAQNDQDYSYFERLLGLVTHPYTQQQNTQEYETGAPTEFGDYQTFCGT
jgi:uncharacterized protein YdiU (UPF0061 family)